MELDVLLLILRILAGLLLLAFVLVVFAMLWRDYAAVSKEVRSRTRQRGRLIAVHTNGSTIKTGAIFPLLPLTSFGRAPSNTVILDDSFASNEHAQVTLRSGQWWLEDLGSSNGTLLNGYRIEEPVVVSTGDVIAMGQVELKLELD